MRIIKSQMLLQQHGNLFTISIIIGVLAALLISTMATGLFVILAGWDSAAMMLFGLVCYSFLPLKNGERTKKVVSQEGIRYPALDLLIILAAMMSIFTAILLLTRSKGNSVEIAFCMLSIFITWNLIQLLYSVHYTEMYYQRNSGVSFNDTQNPNFWDFLYLSYTIGMTYQVSDNSFSTTHFRRVALGHALISFSFSTVLIAITINFVGGLMM
ncbi:DUF1345 domain-containing protein [Leuconostoc falkenbergense]|uniref:DUF1345 domain-containing protein n=1 Tax=Leuconostoc falkenbergense TaxID=2766470 RepID=UPI001F5554AE|nr:DUF1345 domain-containing protein [Leuconostoc falkenbergense]MDI6554121.1 DUF1345 domain-containing protein [Leuconostoc falkenbergense]